MPKRKLLPLGIQTYRDIRSTEREYIYIDKTKEALELTEADRYYLLSRPRRFGKSLFLDTLSEIFLGHKQYFEGLYIYDKYDWEQTYPVIKISFGSGSYSDEVLINNEFERIFEENNKKLGLNIEYRQISDARKCFYNLIVACYEKFNKKVVVLIDEYDKLILDNISNPDKSMSLKARDILRNFYSALKDNDDKLRFVFMTGVSKFSKLNLFSGLNNIQDITLSKKYATITGYTHEDLKNHFAEYLEGIDLEKVKKWYNGYNYFGESIYNPYDILLFLSNDASYSNYWWETGNPRFLIEKLKENKYYLPDLENTIASKETLSAFDVEHIDLVALLWQTGYLTFDKEIPQLESVTYKMKVPNLEIQKSLNALFFGYLTDIRHSTSTQINTINFILEKDFEGFKTEIQSLFASIPYQNYVNNNMGTYEGYYASVMYAFMSSLGFLVHAEDTTNTGRADMTLIGPNEVVVLEFKVDMPSEDALQQIKSKRYFKKYQNQNKPIYLVGIHFSSKQRNIDSLVWEKM